MNENPYQSPESHELTDAVKPPNPDNLTPEWPLSARVGTLGFVGFSTTSLLFWTLQPYAAWEGALYSAPSSRRLPCLPKCSTLPGDSS